MANKPLKIIQNSQKQMPCNIEAEQALIGSVLVSNDIYDEITLIVSAQKFFDPIHAKIFDTIEMLIHKGLLANPITLKNHFENNEGLKELGGQEYLIKITKFSKRAKENGELYGAIKPLEISKAIESSNKIEIKPLQIDLSKEIKKIGSYEAKINLHAEIQAKILIAVVKEKDKT